MTIEEILYVANRRGKSCYDLIVEVYKELESRSCDGCKYDEKDDSYPSICCECSRYYADRYEPKDKQCLKNQS